MKEITTQEKEEFVSFWSNQREAIKDRISEETNRWVNTYTASNNIGYDFGQLRPGKDGQWDLYWYLTGEQSIGCDENETLIASGLTATEVAQEKRREYYHGNGVNPDDAIEVAMFNHLQSLGPEEMEAQIVKFELQLAESESI